MDREINEKYYHETWKVIKELAEQKKAYNEDFERRLIENERQLKETDRQLKETDRQLKEQSEKTEKQLRKFSEETEKKYKETYELIKESSIKTDKYLGKVKEFDRNWGKLVESLVAPSVAKQFKSFDIDGTSQRVEKHKNGKTIEIDILLTNSSIIIPVEVKTTLDVNAVNEHIERHLIPFKEFFTEHTDKTIYGAVAYIHVAENADRYAYQKGLYVLTFGDNDMVVIKNDDKFRPVSW